ncbi:unnamed protein product [Lathyrus sativus]|nr:unnamed protein product [Lathyrus sativus]
MSSNSSIASNSIDSFNGIDSVDSKITLSKIVVDVVMEHGVTLDEEDEIACIYCEHYVTTRGVYQFLHHLAGTETKPCDGVSEEVKNEMMEILTINMGLKPISVASSPSGSFYGDVSVDSSKNVMDSSKSVIDVILEHSVLLDEGLLQRCRYCDDYLATHGGYHFLCHLAGTENDVKACEGIAEEVKKEVLDIFHAFRESNTKGCVSVGEKRKCNEVAVESSREVSKRRKRDGSQAAVKNEVKKSLREETYRAIASFFYNNGIPLDAVKSDEFKCMCDLVSRHGLGFELPSFDDIKGKL